MSVQICSDATWPLIGTTCGRKSACRSQAGWPFEILLPVIHLIHAAIRMNVDFFASSNLLFSFLGVTVVMLKQIRKTHLGRGQSPKNLYKLQN